MKKHRLVTMFLIAIMTTAILTVAVPLTSGDPWSPGYGPPITVGDAYVGGSSCVSDWGPIKPLNVDPLGDTEGWSFNGTTSLWPDGRLVEPPASVPAADAARDLEALYMWFDPATDIYIRLDLAGLTPGFGFAPPPAPPTLNYSMFGMTLSTDLAAGTGYTNGPYSGLMYTTPCEWEYLLVWSEGWIWVVGWNGTDTVFVDGDPASAAAYGLIGNCSIGVDYAAGAIEIMIPRASIENPAVPDPGLWRGNLEAVSITLASFKPGLWPGVTSPYPGPAGGGAGGLEDTILHPFDPQGVINGVSPPLAGEEAFQAGVGGPDHADIMAPGVVTGVQPLPGWYLVDPESQKLVDMSVGSKLHVVDAATGQQNITDVYSYDDTFTVNLTLVDAVNLSSWLIGLQWTPGVLECLSWTTLFNTPVMGPSSNYLEIAGSINNTKGVVEPYSYSLTAAAVTAGAWKSGSGTLAQVVFRVNVTFGSTWICPYQAKLKGSISGLGSKIDLEYTEKNAWFLRSPPPPGPPELIYTQDPTAPPHYPGDPITFDLSGSDPGFNGTDYVPILNYSFSVWNSSGLLYTYLGPSAGPHVFTPLSADTYIFGLDIHLDPDFDPDYPSGWLVVEQNVTKVVIEKALTGIDCYTDPHRWCGYYSPFQGKGWNMSADAYALDEMVTVYSYVFYNGWPKQSFLVSYEVYDANGTLVLVRNAMTNASGIANMSFRILTVCMDPEYAFGKWHIYQKVRMSDEYFNDTLWFDVGWLVELLDVIPAESVYYVGDPVGDHMTFTISYKSIGQIPRDIVWAVTVYDDEDVPIDVMIGEMTVTPGEFCNPAYDEFVVTCLEIPKWAYAGVAKVYVNAWYNYLPTECGHPTSPEISALFIISAP